MWKMTCEKGPYYIQELELGNPALTKKEFFTENIIKTTRITDIFIILYVYLLSVIRTFRKDNNFQRGQHQKLQIAIASLV